jgi:hypothetical protein
METTSFVRQIPIERPAAEVKGFLRQVPNLPRWTRFFRSAGERDGTFYTVETLMGPAHTRIDEEPGDDPARLTIVTFFGSRKETASIEVAGRGGGSEVRFHLRLPAGLPRAKIDAQLAQLEGELRTLRALLESPEPVSAGGAP